MPEEPAVMPTLERVISAPAETGPALRAQSASNPGLTDMPPLKYRGKELMDRAKATDFFRYVERDGFVRMKSQDEYPGGGRGVDPKVVYPRAACTEVNFPELGYDPRVKDHAVLVKQDDGTWLARDAKTGEETRPIDGKRYNFATMPDDTIRIGTEPHPKLAGFAPYLKYAGEVVFQAGKEVEGIGRTGTYVSPLDKGEELSGFNCKFRTQL